MANVHGSTDSFDIAIIGSGPAGLSAAARAAYYQSNTSHILLEAFSSQSKTIHDYQKRKFVMAEPGFLNLRSEMSFTAGTREQILEKWLSESEHLSLNIRYNASIISIDSTPDEFAITLSDGDIVNAKNIVLAIGCQGNPRQIGVEHDGNSDFIRYTLSDPADFSDKVIVVIGAGDAAIENAMALCAENQVYIINRKNEFSRAKEGNLNQILGAINDDSVSLSSLYTTTVAAIELPDAPGALGQLILDTPTGQKVIECHHVIARLGAIAPRALVESFGVNFANANADALPELDAQYQSNVPGLYIIGALGGFPLIKQAMNQGYDVIEHILGNEIQAADYPLLQGQFSRLPYVMDAEAILTLYKKRVPMFKKMSMLAFRELIIESEIVRSTADNTLLSTSTSRHETTLVPSDTFLYEKGEYGGMFYTLIEGNVALSGEETTQLKAGQFFGENSLLSGHPHYNSATIGDESIVIATPRRIMLKLMMSNEVINQGIDRMFVARLIDSVFKPELPAQQLDQLIDSLSSKSLNAGQTLYERDAHGDAVYLVRSGNISLVNNNDGHNVISAQRSAGELVGQIAMMGNPIYQDSAIAAVKSSVLVIARSDFFTLVSSNPQKIQTLQGDVSQLLKQQSLIAASGQDSHRLAFLLEQGIGEATNAMLIKQSLCIGCDNCETACASTHQGVSRLNRQIGAISGDIHIPNACQHCQEPHCMKDCPTNAINRNIDGQVSIDDKCIGCGNCASNCPYNAITMGNVVEKQAGLWSRLLWGAKDVTHAHSNEGQKKALKCDACSSINGGPACVRACPTGAAVRVNPDQLISMLRMDS